MSPFEASLMPHAASFLAGDRIAFGAIYSKTHGILRARAVDKGADEQDAEDIASEAILYVASRGDAGWDGKSLMALLNRATDWYTHKSKRNSRMVVNSDLPIHYTMDDIGEEYEHPVDLETMEEQRILEGAMQHPIWTSITTRTPEDILVSDNLREKLERIGREGCGDHAWEVYASVTLNGATQKEAAEQFGISQQRVSQICLDMPVAIRKGLLGA